MQNSDPRDRIVYPIHKLMIDSYKVYWGAHSFLFLLLNIRLWVLVRTASMSISNFVKKTLNIFVCIVKVYIANNYYFLIYRDVQRIFDTYLGMFKK